MLRIRLCEEFLSFYEETIDAQDVSSFILFCRITYNPFCSVEVNTATFHRLGFTFVRRCIVVKYTFAKERHFPDNLIISKLYIFKYLYLILSLNFISLVNIATSYSTIASLLQY